MRQNDHFQAPARTLSPTLAETQTRYQLEHRGRNAPLARKVSRALGPSATLRPRAVRFDPEGLRTARGETRTQPPKRLNQFSSNSWRPDTGSSSTLRCKA